MNHPRTSAPSALAPLTHRGPRTRLAHTYQVLDLIVRTAVPLATTKAWLHATLLHLVLVNCLLAPLKIWLFTVAMPLLISDKLRRLRHPKRAPGLFPFRTPMHDSAVDYLAARHTHLPIARFLLSRQSHDAGATDEQPTPSPNLTLVDVAAAARRAAGASPRSSAAPPNAPKLDELLQVGDAQRDGGDHDGERYAIPSRGQTRARSHRLRRRTCCTTLALVALSLVMFFPANLHGIIIEETIVVLVSVVLAAALEATSIVRLFAAAWGELVRAHGPAALAAPLVAAAAAVVAAGISVRARRAHRRATKAGPALEANIHRREAGMWCWPAALGTACDGDFDAVLFSLATSHGTPSRNHAIRVAPA